MRIGLIAFCISLCLTVYLYSQSRHLPPPVVSTTFEPPAESVCAASPNWADVRSNPMYVLMHAQGLDLSDPAKFATLKKKLDALEPGGPHGNVKLGYVLMELPLSFYVQKEGAWQLDLSKLDTDLAKASELNRPFVFYLLADHYQSYGLPYLMEMRKNPLNMMQYRDGTIPDETFFQFHLTSFTLSDDERIPVVKATHEAMRQIAFHVKAFDEEHPGLLVGVELNGETHDMFHHFFDGTGDYTNLDFSDYSPASLTDFAAYLKAHHLPGHAQAIRQIDFRHGESGLLPISGWLTGRSPVKDVAVYLDGAKFADVIYPTSRMDVYEAPGKHLADPNVGFGAWVDVSALTPGRHLLQVIAERDGKPPIEIGRRGIVSGARNNEKIQPEIAVEPLGNGWQGSLDQPVEGYTIRYDPLARAWLAFRNAQIEAHVQTEAAIFRQAGFGEERLYSYQFAPWMVGGWNELLFGIGQDFFRMKGMRPGINTYNGNLMNPVAYRSVDTAHGYAIPETHPQMPGAEGAIAQALRWHYCHGAIFISPFFLSLLDKPVLEGHDKFAIDPANHAWGSDDFYRAIRDFVRH